ncbi:hypothetical protein SLEP1_g16029 [Rubroshorea leprosula]|uniref:Uncharacterized protein n=1 Tax=Rubroshorea leprosula TaxID=152421 RepID=A0AAV5IX53_9ROSI|nr:hypothetical protein SLEP1_g16029 [Rubroshorea leprosula]
MPTMCLIKLPYYLLHMPEEVPEKKDTTGMRGVVKSVGLAVVNDSE